MAASAMTKYDGNGSTLNIANWWPTTLSPIGPLYTLKLNGIALGQTAAATGINQCWEQSAVE